LFCTWWGKKVRCAAQLLQQKGKAKRDQSSIAGVLVHAEKKLVIPQTGARQAPVHD